MATRNKHAAIEVSALSLSLSFVSCVAHYFCVVLLCCAVLCCQNRLRALDPDADAHLAEEEAKLAAAGEGVDSLMEKYAVNEGSSLVRSDSVTDNKQAAAGAAVTSPQALDPDTPTVSEHITINGLDRRTSNAPPKFHASTPSTTDAEYELGGGAGGGGESLLEDDTLVEEAEVGAALDAANAAVAAASTPKPDANGMI